MHYLACCQGLTLGHMVLQDIRVCAAYCLSHILKLHAPESPYTTAQLQVSSKPVETFSMLSKEMPCISYTYAKMKDLGVS